MDGVIDFNRDRRALLIVPASRGTAIAGDRIVLNRQIRFLEERFDCQQLTLDRDDGFRKYLNVLLHVLPLEIAAYWSKNHRKSVRSKMVSGEFHSVFILHEGLFHLGNEIDVTKVRLTLFAQNLISRYTSGTSADRLLNAISRRYERKCYARPGARLVLISRGDLAEALRLGVATHDTPLALPGAPPALPLDSDAVFSGEAVITGTYGWWRKRRDLKNFKLTTLNVTAFDPLVTDSIPGAKILSPAAEMDWGREIRVGIITDRFAAGFKLKALEYVARNCLIFSCSPLFEEFEGLPHAREFVIDQLDETHWPACIEKLKLADQKALRIRFLEFKAACLKRYDWATCLDNLVEQPRPDYVGASNAPRP